MSETIDASRLAEQLSELLDRARAGERFVIEREGLAVAELAPPSVEHRHTEAEREAEREAGREAALVRSLEARGLLAPRETGDVVPFSERPLFKVQGKPVSETIIEDRDWTP